MRLEGLPKRCAKCKSMKWNKSGVVAKAKESAPKVESVVVGRSKRPPHAVQVEVRPVTQEPVVEPEDVIADEDIPNSEPELPMCTYREYDDQEGEWYGCRLREHGPKVKHQRGEKL